MYPSDYLGTYSMYPLAWTPAQPGAIPVMAVAADYRLLCNPLFPLPLPEGLWVMAPCIGLCASRETRSMLWIACYTGDAALPFPAGQ